MPSPHAMVMRQGRPGLGHSQYGSTLQTPEQPSPGKLLPSSQRSLAWFSSPSPHAGPDGPISKHSGGGSATSHGSGSSPPPASPPSPGSTMIVPPLPVPPLPVPPVAEVPPSAPVPFGPALDATSGPPPHAASARTESPTPKVRSSGTFTIMSSGFFEKARKIGIVPDLDLTETFTPNVSHFAGSRVFVGVPACAWSPNAHPPRSPSQRPALTCKTKKSGFRPPSRGLG